MNPRISIIIPAFNEEDTIADVVKDIQRYIKWPYEILVIDDGSSDQTAQHATDSGTRVITHPTNRGYIEALRTGFHQAQGDIVVTMDGDGQHNPRDIPRLVQPIFQNQADLVIGERRQLSRSEQVITYLTQWRVDVTDACSGYKAIITEIAKSMTIKGKCICGTFILEAKKLGARITGVATPIASRRSGGSRSNKQHLIQCLFVIKELVL